MIRQMFILIWNRKRRHFLLILEICVAFIVLFEIGGMIAQTLIAYTQPLGFSYENVWILETARSSSGDGTRGVCQQIQRELLATPEVINVTWTSRNTPYSMLNSTMDQSMDDGRHFSANMFSADDHFAEVLGLTVIEGRWFAAEDNATQPPAAVINRHLRDEWFGSEPAVGQVLGDYRIVGVIDNYRYAGELDEPGNALFERDWLEADEGRILTSFLFTVKPGATAELEADITRRIAAVTPGWTVGVRRLESIRDDYFRLKLLGLIIFGIIAGFLIFNVALGLFGVLWYSISRRRAEIGLRCAVGACPSHITRQILGEALVLTTFGVGLGLVIAVQFPILDAFSGIGPMAYLLAIVGAALFIYLTVSACAIYPGRLAARIQPAVALHDE